MSEGMPQPGILPLFPCRVLSSESVGPNRWSYQIEQVVKASEGYAELSSFPGGIRGVAYNMLENGNTGSGVEGNGVDVDDLPAGFSLGPIPSGDWPLLAYAWSVASGRPELWLRYPNPVVGECSA